MLFSSTVFIYLFLPFSIIGYYVLHKSRKLQNVFLLFMSLFFYAWGEPKFLLIMLLQIVVNYTFGLLVDKAKKSGSPLFPKLIIALTVIFNLSILFVFKYLNFSVTTINEFFNTGISIKKITLPIGISFFTFQAMSYVIDVYRDKGAVQKNIINVSLYISFFPQLIAGPIVRYETVAEQIENRKETLNDFVDGFARFIIGFAKKVLLANTFASVADNVFALNANNSEVSVLLSWLGAICYTLQIFYDFSGYSDMAIGLGRMFGFHFLENFNYPYISTSITEFWRRWHISLGSWFRDYVYFPLGGSRVNKPRLLFNLFVVWLLTGIWHGANWTFIVWGLMYFVLLTIEKLTGFYKTKSKIAKPFLWIYSMLFVVLGWVFFRADTIPDAVNYIMTMFGINNTVFYDSLFLSNAKPILICLFFGILFSFPVIPKLKEKIKSNVITDILYIFVLVLIFVIALSSIVSSSYNPFIYFNF